MRPKSTNSGQMTFYQTFEEQLSRRHSLYQLANKIDWQGFEEAFLPLYCQDNGRPAKDPDPDIQRTKDATEDLDRHLPGFRHTGSSGSHHPNPAAFIPPVSEE